jgi:hypothetical protein
MDSITSISGLPIIIVNILLLVAWTARQHSGEPVEESPNFHQEASSQSADKKRCEYGLFNFNGSIRGIAISKTEL